MLSLRNTNQVQSLGRDIQRGITNVCCTPTLNSVTTASFTELNVNVTFGAYLINCKSCVGGYIQVSEDNGSTWTTINPGNCSPSNLVPMPSQSAYYRAFTSCSSVNQPFDPLTSSFSNEIFFVPNSRLNYSFDERGAEGEFKLIVTGSTLLSTTTDANGTFYEIPSASVVSASVGTISVPTTGSTSMSLWITGSNVSFYTSSCVSASGSLFIGDYIAIPNQDYYVTASIDHRPENFCNSASYSDFKFTVNSYDQSTSIWYETNANGTYTPGTGISASVSGSAVKTNIFTGDCRQNAIQFSGSITFVVPTGNIGNSVYLAIVTGSFTIGGGVDGYGWSLSSTYADSGSVNISFGGGGAQPFNDYNATTKNSLVGTAVTGQVGPFGRRNVNYVVSGSLISNNPPVTGIGFPDNLGNSFTLTGEGVIRAFGYGTTGTTSMQAQYNCMFETTPSK